jgi:hypothetical protein
VCVFIRMCLMRKVCVFRLQAVLNGFAFLCEFYVFVFLFIYAKINIIFNDILVHNMNNL